MYLSGSAEIDLSLPCILYWDAELEDTSIFSLTYASHSYYGLR